MSKIFEKYATKLGLVPMRIVHGFTPHAAGEIAGFPPATAAGLYQAGDAVVVDENGEEVEIAVSKPASSPAGKTDESVSGIDIPDAWEGLHHLQRVKLAKAISGRTDVAKTEEADAIIRAEVARRAAG